MSFKTFLGQDLVVVCRRFKRLSDGWVIRNRAVLWCAFPLSLSGLLGRDLLWAVDQEICFSGA